MLRVSKWWSNWSKSIFFKGRAFWGPVIKKVSVCASKMWPASLSSLLDDSISVPTPIFWSQMKLIVSNWSNGSKTGVLSKRDLIGAYFFKKVSFRASNMPPQSFVKKLNFKGLIMIPHAKESWQCLPDDPIGKNVWTVNKPLWLSLKNAIFFKRVFFFGGGGFL